MNGELRQLYIYVLKRNWKIVKMEKYDDRSFLVYVSGLFHRKIIELRPAGE